MRINFKRLDYIKHVGYIDNVLKREICTSTKLSCVIYVSDKSTITRIITYQVL